MQIFFKVNYKEYCKIIYSSSSKSHIHIERLMPPKQVFYFHKILPSRKTYEFYKGKYILITLRTYNKLIIRNIKQSLESQYYYYSVNDPMQVSGFGEFDWWPGKEENCL